MFTAKDMYKAIHDNSNLKGDIVDVWLQEVVLPSKLKGGYESAFDCPEGLTLKEIEVLLKVRGFDVKTWSDHQGSFVSVKIPPQGE
jgi:hypothetical protein